jgi:mRNA interferase MazF
MYKQGDIVLVPFPFTDLSSSKVRPAVILSAFPQQKPDVMLAFISSKIPEKNPYGIIVKPSNKNGLKIPSIIRLDKIATLDKRIILGSIGKMPSTWLQKNIEVFMSMFNLKK